MKGLKKIIALALVFTMLCCLPVSAADVLSKTRVSNGKVTVTNSKGKKTYTLYKQSVSSYTGFVRHTGCTITTASIAASAYGKRVNPNQIHTGAASAKTSERYALNKMGASSQFYDKAAPSLKTISQILTDMGIKNKCVYKYTNSKAISDIRANLNAGKPVIVVANNKTVNGVRIANSFHGLVLLGFDKNKKVIFADPMKGKMNYAHACQKTVHPTLKALVTKYMSIPSGSATAPYYTNTAMAGGYILVTK